MNAHSCNRFEKTAKNEDNKNRAFFVLLYFRTTVWINPIVYGSSGPFSPDNLSDPTDLKPTFIPTPQDPISNGSFDAGTIEIPILNHEPSSPFTWELVQRSLGEVITTTWDAHAALLRFLQAHNEESSFDEMVQWDGIGLIPLVLLEHLKKKGEANRLYYGKHKNRVIDGELQLVAVIKNSKLILVQ